MYLEEELIYKGFFWFDDKEERFQADVRVEKDGEISVEAYVEFDANLFDKINSDNFRKFNLQGYINNQFATLNHCSIVSHSIDMFSSIRFKIKAKTLVIGVAYDSEDEFLIDKVLVFFTHLDTWLGITGISDTLSFSDENSLLHIDVNYVPPKPINFKMGEYECSFKFGVSRKQKNSISDITIIQSVYLEIVSKQEKPLKEFRELIHKLSQFFKLSTDSKIYLTNFYAFNNSIIDENTNRPFRYEIYYRGLYSSSNELKKLESSEMIFTYKDIKHCLDRVFTNWLTSYEQISPAIALFFAYKSDSFEFLDSKFLCLAQGLETLHRRTYKGLAMEENEFQKKFSRIMDNADELDKQWLSERFKYANEVSLRQRIKDLVKPFEQYYGNRRQRKSFVTNLVLTRNYLTHYNEELSESCNKGVKLLKTVMRMEVLFTLHLLKVVGFDDKDINNLLTQQNILYRKIDHYFNIET